MLDETFPTHIIVLYDSAMVISKSRLPGLNYMFYKETLIK